jgi:hypothetical protein
LGKAGLKMDNAKTAPTKQITVMIAEDHVVCVKASRR